MFFLISKLLWMLLAPVTALLAVAAMGLVLHAVGRRRTGWRLVCIGTAGLIVVGIVPLGGMLLRPLEDRFPAPPEGLAAPTGVIVLGGSTDEDIALARGRVTVTTAGDRMTEAIVLARRYPEARMIFTGGSAAVGGSQGTEAGDVRRLWIDMGLPETRITTEDRSRNTDENVRFTKPIVDPKPGETWLLVTSAYHMPRAVAIFRANDWPVIPDPVDYRTRGTIHDASPNLDIFGNWERLDLAVHEWVGLVAYRLSGRTATLLPAP